MNEETMTPAPSPPPAIEAEGGPVEGVTHGEEVTPGERSKRSRRPMRRRPHLPRGVARVVLILMGAVVLLGLGGAAYATYEYSRDHDGLILPGARVGGVEVGGMTHEAALSAVQSALSDELDREITLDDEGRSWTVTPRQLGAWTDAKAAVDAAMSESENSSFLKLMSMSVLKKDLGFERDVNVHYRRGGAERFVAELATEVNRKASDAELDYSTGWVKIRKEKEGRKLVPKATTAALMEALRDGDDSVDIAVKETSPEVTADSFDQVLLVRIGENKLYLYEDGKITREWLVATGLPEFPTPTGVYEVELKRYMPTWINPQPDGWGASMPDSIPPGIGNPLGLRAINWTASGIRFHGTTAISSLGRNASHGCVRMSNDDVIELYDIIEVGAPIVSLQSGAYSPLYDSVPDPNQVTAN